MKRQTSCCTGFAAFFLAVAWLIYASTSYAACVTRKLEGRYSRTGWMDEKVCAEGEYPVSAGGGCTGNGMSMKGVSTTAGTNDQRIWLWCTQDGPALWYAMCCAR